MSTSRLYLNTYDEPVAVSPLSVQEPLDLTLTKNVLRFTSTSEDALIQDWIASARQLFETMTGRQLITATRIFGLDGFPYDGVIELPRPPLQSVTGVVYDDSSGVEQTLDEATYTVIGSGLDAHAPRGRIVLGDGESWPSVIAGKNTVRVTYVAGYAERHDDIPPLIKAVLYDMVRKFHARSDDQLPWTTQLVLNNLQHSAAQTLRPWRQTWLV